MQQATAALLFLVLVLGTAHGQSICPRSGRTGPRGLPGPAGPAGPPGNGSSSGLPTGAVARYASVTQDVPLYVPTVVQFNATILNSADSGWTVVSPGALRATAAGWYQVQYGVAVQGTWTAGFSPGEVIYWEASAWYNLTTTEVQGSAAYATAYILAGGDTHVGGLMLSQTTIVAVCPGQVLQLLLDVFFQDTLHGEATINVPIYANADSIVLTTASAVSQVVQRLPIAPPIC